MPGTMTARALPMNNIAYPVSVAAIGVIPLHRYCLVIGPVTTDPPTTYGDWAGTAFLATDVEMLTETRTKGPGGQALSTCWLVPGHYGVAAGTPVYLGLFAGITPGSGTIPAVVLLVGEINEWL